MKKRIFAIILFTLMLLPILCLPALAAESGSPFPFSDYADKHLEVYTAYPAWERDLREENDPERQKLSYTNLVTVCMVNHMGNLVAEQTAELKVYKIDGGGADHQPLKRSRRGCRKGALR